MELYFGSIWSTLSTIFIFVIIGYYIDCMFKRKRIISWGRHCVAIVVLGLVLCCFVVMRDGYVEAIQGGKGLFALNSLQIYVAYGMAVMIAILLCTLLFIRKQKHRQYLYSILAVCILCKTIWIEVARLLP